LAKSRLVPSAGSDNLSSEFNTLSSSNYSPQHFDLLAAIYLARSPALFFNLGTEFSHPLLEAYAYGRSDYSGEAAAAL
jgi:hypothetical protein